MGWSEWREMLLNVPESLTFFHGQLTPSSRTTEEQWPPDSRSH